MASLAAEAGFVGPGWRPQYKGFFQPLLGARAGKWAPLFIHAAPPGGATVRT
ncbi:hypothetical protein ACWC6I_42705 [Streptomyces sp. NPDC001414]